MPETATTPWDYWLHIPNDPRAVTVSRRTLRLILTLHGLIGLVDEAELLATELVANAVQHTGGPSALRVCWGDGVLRIAAWDGDPHPPQPPCFAGDFDGDGDGLVLEDGRGLALVQACSDLWGWKPLVREGRAGKYVWCDLAGG